MRTRWLLVALATQVAVLPLLLAAGPPPQTKGLRTLRLIHFPPGDAATMAARARGFLAAEGLDVEVTNTPNSTVQMRGLSDGTWDLAYTAFDNVLAWSGREGAQIVAVAQYETGIYLPIYVRPEIRAWEDLRGKPLAVDAIDTAFALVLRRVLQAHDLDLERGDYELVAVGATGQRLESLQRGETFAGVLSSPFDVQAEASGLRKIGDQSEVLPDYPGQIIAVNQAWARANRDTLVRFLRAWLAGARWVQANREAALDLWAADQGIAREALITRLTLGSPDGSLNLPGLASVLDLRTRFGFTLPMGSEIAPYYDLSYYQAARGQ
jgi:ABC-type nitrate/sulfonate/bicarbonate transport system substrate-binding protein